MPSRTVSRISSRRDRSLHSRPCYTGVGSRRTPFEVMKLMTRIAYFLERRGYVLRSGGAVGADAAFEAGVSDGSMKEVYLPWRGFNTRTSPYEGVDEAALKMAESFHPAWDALSTGARELHARNCYQVLGRGLDDPSRFIVCWTSGGRRVGGTAQALRVASHYGIPVFNLARDSDLSHVMECIRTEQIFA